MIKREIYPIISRYLINRLTHEENEQLDAWKIENEENRILFDSIVNQWNSKNKGKLSILGSDEVKERIWIKLNQGASYQSKKNRVLFPIFLKYAAVFLIIISAIFAFYEINKTDSREALVSNRIVKSNPAGQKTEIKLSDGSIVILNSQSEVSYNSIFSDTSRIITLEGEAFFSISKDSLRPFYVYTHGIKIKALGTSFNVKSFSNSNKIFVSLSTGKVVVDRQSNSNGSIELLPGEQVIFDKNSRVFSPIAYYDRLEVESWKSGYLYFKKANINAIVNELEKWYGVEILVESLPDQAISYTGLFKKQNLENVLTSIGFVVNFEFEIDEKDVIITFKNE